jgi:deoxyribodipyrimidine photolyase
MIYCVPQARSLWGRDASQKAGEQSQVGIVWLWDDVRLEDHEPLLAAHQQCQHVVPVYVLDVHNHQKVRASSMQQIDKQVFLHLSVDTNAMYPQTVCIPHWLQAAGCSQQGSTQLAFLLDRLNDLRTRLTSLGSELLLRSGRPEHVLPQLVRAIQRATQSKVTVFFHQQLAPMQQQVTPRAWV